MEAPLHSHVFRFNTISLIDKMTSDSHGIFEALSEIGVPFVSNIVDRSPISCGCAPDLYLLFLLSVSCCTLPYLVPFLVLGLSPFVSLSDYAIPCILKYLPVLTSDFRNNIVWIPPTSTVNSLLRLGDINEGSHPLSCTVLHYLCPREVDPTHFR